MCDVKVFLTFTSLNLLLLWQLFYLICSSIVINTGIVTAEPLTRKESGKFGVLKSDSTHHFFRNACTKSGSLRFHSFLVFDWFCLFIYLWVWLSLCKIVRSSVILLLPLFIKRGRSWISFTSLNPTYFCICPQSSTEFPMLHVANFFFLFFFSMV
jgi:hypothetical protein